MLIGEGIERETWRGRITPVYVCAVKGQLAKYILCVFVCVYICKMSCKVGNQETAFGC